MLQSLGLLALAGLASAAGPLHHKPEPHFPEPHGPEPHEPSSTVDWETAFTATPAADVAAAAATAKTSSPTSHVRGKAFQRLIIFYFENEDYDKAAGDRTYQLPFRSHV